MRTDVTPVHSVSVDRFHAPELADFVALEVQGGGAITVSHLTYEQAFTLWDQLALVLVNPRPDGPSCPR